MISLPHSLLRSVSSSNRPDKPSRLFFQGASSSPQKSSPPQDTFQTSLDEAPGGSRAPSPAPNMEALAHSVSTPEKDVLSRFLETLGDLVQLAENAQDAPLGLNPDFADAYGDTLLMLATGTGNAEVTRLLLTLGAQVNAQNPKCLGHTPLIMGILANANAAACVEALGQSPELDVNLADVNGNSPLAYAVTANNPAILEYLLAKGANPNQPNQEGVTPLAHACDLQKPLLVQKLLAAKADPNLPDKEGDTPLLIAAARGNRTMVKALLEAGANPNHWNEYRMSPLGYAILQGDRAFAHLLLQHGAQPDALNHWGQTLLNQLCQFDAPAAVDLLLSVGANVNQENFQGVTPLKQAILSNQPGVVARLLAAPDLKERADIQRAWQALKGEAELSGQACQQLANYLTAPFFANPLRENPESDLEALFSRFSRISQNWQNNPRLRALKQQSPEVYKRYCSDYLMNLIQPPAEGDGAGNPFAPLSGYFPNASQTGEAVFSQVPRRLVAGHNYLLSPLNSRRINANLERRLTELEQERPSYWRKMRADELYRLFDNHQFVVEAKRENPADYLLACKAFLGLMAHCFAEMDENPGLAQSLKPHSYQKHFRAEITRILERKELHPALDTVELHNLLTQS